MKTKKWILLVLVWPLQVLGWGSLGHRTIGALADQGLSPKARAAVEKILSAAKDPTAPATSGLQGKTLADIASWADSIRSSGAYKQTVWYHFEKIPDNVSFLDNLRTMPAWQQKKGGVLTALLVATEKLSAANVSASERADALKFLVHFVGDIHQPMHTGRPEDRGGVKINVVWFGTPMSLHKVWDSGMIMTGHADIVGSGTIIDDEDLVNRAPIEQNDLLLSEVVLSRAGSSYTDYLAQQFGAQTFETKMDVEGWLNESLALRLPAYDPLYEKDQPRYQQLHLAEIDQRIYVAGVRLAQLINDIIDAKPLPALEAELWQRIEAVVGDLHVIVKLTP